eukprot:m.892331 g.892331  ORF g.892331 m.892331 type:complete len:94 (+) comp23656_c1_seq1:1702-1983(+)
MIVSKASVAHMINFTAPEYSPGHSFKFYGMGTFNLDWSVGDGSIAAYGHVGDTYGYQSQTTYFPSHDFVLTVVRSRCLADVPVQPNLGWLVLG